MRTWVSSPPFSGLHADLTDVSADQHHAQDHAARHAAGGADELSVQDLKSSDIGARAYHNADQTITSGPLTTLALNSERWDTDAIHDTVTNNSRLTCKTAGKYVITANIKWQNIAGGTRRQIIRLNGITDIAQAEQLGTGIIEELIHVITIYNLAVNDYVEIAVLQNSGGGVTVRSAAQVSPEFMMQKIG